MQEEKYCSGNVGVRTELENESWRNRSPNFDDDMDDLALSCVNTSTEASGSMPRAMTRKLDPLLRLRIRKKVEVLPRTNSQVWKATGKSLGNVGYKCEFHQERKVALWKSLICALSMETHRKEFALHPSVSGPPAVQNLDLEEEMDGLLYIQFRTLQALALKFLRCLITAVSSLGLDCQKKFTNQFKPRSSQMSLRASALASLRPPFLKRRRCTLQCALSSSEREIFLLLIILFNKFHFLHAQVQSLSDQYPSLPRMWVKLKWITFSLDLQKLQKNAFFSIFVIFFRNTNVMLGQVNLHQQMFHLSYILLFWNALTHDAKTGVYSFQVNEHWLNLSADLLRKALNVTPADNYIGSLLIRS
ncbi:hypothetical protein Tco_0103064 [Tanacetum coccineum]